MINYTDKIDKIYNEASVKLVDLEPWEGYYLARKIGFEIMLSRVNLKNDAVGLEIGCGNAFQSALLSSFSRQIFATDLYNENGTTHSTGIYKAKDSIQRLNIKNVKIISCSAEYLPFPDSYFDFVFSSSVLEHIPQRKMALNEINRVLKPAGKLILILPTHMPSIYAFFHVFLYVLARVARLLLNATTKSIAKKSNNNNSGVSLFKRFRKNHPSFPLPEPHGAYPNVFIELKQQIPSRWETLIVKSGFKVTKSFSTCFIPWSFIEPFSTKFAASLYDRSKCLHLKFADNPFLKNFSYLACFIARKN